MPTELLHFDPDAELVIREGRVKDYSTEAWFSEDEAYRYALWWKWDDSLSPLLVCMLNPSTATEVNLDPTITGMLARAAAWGYGALIVINLFAFRATAPADMKAAADPVGPHNDAVCSLLLEYASDDKGALLCGWGAHGSFMGRDTAFKQMAARSLVPTYALRFTKDGHPGHPLYIPRADPLIPFPLAAQRYAARPRTPYATS